MRLRTWLQRACFIGAAGLAGASLLLPATAQTDLEAGRPPIFGGFAYATSVHFALNTDPQQTLPELVRLDIPHGESEFGSGLQSRARASIAYPGSIGQAPSLLCTAGFPCDRFNPPTWPFDANAQYPSQPDAEAVSQGPTVSGGLMSLEGARARAHAGRDHVSTFATGADLLFGNLAGTGSPLTPETALLSVRNSTATTRHEFVDGVLVTTAESVLDGVGIAGGALRIDKIVSRSVSRSDGGEVQEAAPEIVIAGATLDGNPVRITSEGIEVQGEPQDQGLVNSVSGGIATLLSNGAIDVRLMDAEEELGDGGRATGVVTGLQVRYRLDASGFPGLVAAVGDLLLGSVSTSTRASLDDPFDFGGGIVDLGGDPPIGPSVLGEGVGSFDGIELPSAGSGTGSFSKPPAAPGATARGTPPVADAGEGRFGPVNALAGVAERIELLYAAWGLAMVGVAIGSRLPGMRLRSA